MNLLAKVDSTGSALTSWTPLYALLGAFAVIVVALFIFGRSGNTESRMSQAILRVPDGLERIVHIPGWAAATIGMSLFGLLVAGQAFYNDVAWHVSLGRDKNLFTAPHTGIVIGLGLILLAGITGVGLASLQKVETTLRWKAVRIPWSTLPMLALGAGACTGFPLDDFWHRQFGVDVTMWSPTHMLMILGASFVGLAAWLVLAEAGVKPRDSRWAMGIHVVCAFLTLQGLASALGEFAFGVPQFQQMFHPLLLTMASAFAFIAIRLVLGRFWALPLAVAQFAFSHVSIGGDASPIHEKLVGLYLTAAIAVELAAWIFGTERRTRFAIASGVGVGTLGLAGEYWWNHSHAYQPWNSNLFPDALYFCVIAGVAAAIVGVAFARAVARDDSATRVGGPLVAVAGLTLLVALALPMPRHTGDVTAAVHVGQPIGGYANVDVRLTPANAADHARWFQANAWQGGGLEVANMKKLGPGHYRTESRIPVEGNWKALIRLHRGGEMMALPIFLPADSQIHKAEIPAIDRTMKFQPEPKYLLREQHGGSSALKFGVYALLSLMAVVWMAAFSLATVKIAPKGPRQPPTARLSSKRRQAATPKPRSTIPVANV